MEFNWYAIYVMLYLLDSGNNLQCWSQEPYVPNVASVYQQHQSIFPHIIKIIVN